jgi:hypothetical protein
LELESVAVEPDETDAAAPGLALDADALEVPTEPDVPVPVVPPPDATADASTEDDGA